MKIKDFLKIDRPREKLIQMGIIVKILVKTLVLTVIIDIIVNIRV